MERFKERLVAKDYTQTYEADYQETFYTRGKDNYHSGPLILGCKPRLAPSTV